MNAGYVNIYFHDITDRRDTPRMQCTCRNRNIERCSNRSTRGSASSRCFSTGPAGRRIIVFWRSIRPLRSRPGSQTPQDAGCAEICSRSRRAMVRNLRVRGMDRQVHRDSRKPAKGFGRLYDVYVFPVGKPEQRWVAILLNDITERNLAQEAMRNLNATLESKVAERTAELEQRAGQLAEADARIVAGGGPRAQTHGRHPARRSPAAACSHEVPPEPAEQPGPTRSLAAGGRRPTGAIMLVQAVETIPQSFPRAQSRHTLPERSATDVRVAGPADTGAARPHCSCRRPMARSASNPIP